MSDKFVTPCKLPSEYERELLTILIEECSEVQQRATKLLRFGGAEIQPGQDYNNIERLSHEVGDLRQMLALAQDAGLLNGQRVAEGMRRKSAQLAKFMQTSA